MSAQVILNHVEPHQIASIQSGALSACVRRVSKKDLWDGVMISMNVLSIMADVPTAAQILLDLFNAHAQKIHRYKR